MCTDTRPLLYSLSLIHRNTHTHTSVFFYMVFTLSSHTHSNTHFFSSPHTRMHTCSRSVPWGSTLALPFCSDHVGSLSFLSLGPGHGTQPPGARNVGSVDIQRSRPEASCFLRVPPSTETLRAPGPYVAGSLLFSEVPVRQEEPTGAVGAPLALRLLARVEGTEEGRVGSHRKSQGSRDGIQGS